MNYNIVLMTDVYKYSHPKLYPANTTKIYSYFESRGGKFDNTVFFGLQYLLKRYLSNTVVTPEKVDEAENLLAGVFGSGKVFDRTLWDYIIDKHGGRLPLRIKAVKEGSVIPTQNVLMTIENTDPKCYWLTNFIETLLVQTWYPTTVATQSREMKRLILRYLEDTGDPSLIDFKLHDFGFRGVSSVESAGIGGAAHLVNFKGTDTTAALLVARDYYNEPCAGFSIPATEHSTINSWTKAGELDAYRNVLEQFPTGMVACVSDSYDIYKAVYDLWGTELNEQVSKRDGVLVVRPDSGNPEYIVPEIIRLLADRFGATTNSKGFRVLNPKVRVIQGDGIKYDSLDGILKSCKDAGWSLDNVAFGSGGGLLQQLNRDTQKFAFKCSYAEVNGETREVWKSPVTDPGKGSKRGRLGLYTSPIGKIYTSTENQNGDTGLLETVFENGNLIVDQSFSEIRERAKI